MEGSSFTMQSITFQALFKNLDSIREYVGQAASEAGLDDSGIYAVQLAADEACSNIIEHSYGSDENGVIECSTQVKDGYLFLTFRDFGCCFNPKSIDDPDLTSDIKDRQIGGLGLFLIKNLMDDVQYESQGEAGNVLILKKNLGD